MIDQSHVVILLHTHTHTLSHHQPPLLHGQTCLSGDELEEVLRVDIGPPVAEPSVVVVRHIPGVRGASSLLVELKQNLRI